MDLKLNTDYHALQKVPAVLERRPTKRARYLRL